MTDPIAPPADGPTSSVPALHVVEHRRRRHPSDLLRIVLGLAILALASLPVRPDLVGPVEAGLFAAVNSLPDWLFWLAWPPMQLGSLVAVGLVVAAAAGWRRWWLVVEAGVAGTLGWTLAKVVKDAVGRPRPGGLLEEIAFRGGEPVGFGFVSGHTTVAFALATATSLYLPRPWRGRLFALAAVVGLTRIYVGAHLPLDVVGGAALGWIVAATVRLLLGAAAGRPQESGVLAGLRGLGLPVRSVRAMAGGQGAASAFLVQLEDGGEQVAKVVSDRPQDQDLLFRWWSRLRSGDNSPARRLEPPLQQVQHEALMMLMAAQAGVAVPAVRHVGLLDGGHAVLLADRCRGYVVRGTIPRAAAEALQEELTRLHAAGIAHGDLTADHVLVAPDHRPPVTLVGWSGAMLRPPEGILARDRMQLASLLPSDAAQGSRPVPPATSSRPAGP